MNTKQLTYVLVLAQKGSFSRAAEALGISQPSLSQYVRKIERELGVELFRRGGQDIRLTDAGKAYVEAGRKILDLEHQMEARMADLAADRAGSVIVGAAPYRAAGMLPAIAAAFQRLHPGVHLEVREGTTAELADGMEHGEYDLCLTLLPIESRLFAHETVTEEELVYAVPAGRPALPTADIPGRRYPAVEADCLDGERLVMLTEHQFMQRQLDALAAEHHLRVEPAAVVKSLTAQIEMVKAGVGPALVPEGIARFCRPSEVTLYSFVRPLPKRTVVVMWRKENPLSGLAAELKDLIVRMDW